MRPYVERLVVNCEEGLCAVSEGVVYTEAGGYVDVVEVGEAPEVPWGELRAADYCRVGCEMC